MSALVPHIRLRASSEIIFRNGVLVAVALHGCLLLVRPDPGMLGFPLNLWAALTRELAQMVAGKSCIDSRYAACPLRDMP